MDPVVMAFSAGASEAPGADWARFDQSLAQVGGHSARHWEVEDSVYVVVEDVPSWAALQEAVTEADVEPTGAARLVFDPAQTPEPGQDVISALPERLDTKLALAEFPGPSPLEDPEHLICPTCGRMDGRHDSPPH